MKTIIQNKINSELINKNLTPLDDYLEESTFGQKVNYFEKIFLDKKYLIKLESNKNPFYLQFNFDNIKFADERYRFLFNEKYITNYINELKKTNKLRNNLLHKLYLSFAAKEEKLDEVNITTLLKQIEKLIDLDFNPVGAYQKHEFDTGFYLKLKTANFTEKKLMMLDKSLVGKDGSFPPSNYVSMEMLLRIIFYYYSLTFMET